MKKIALIFFLLFAIGSFAQFSKTHYIPPVSGSNNVSSSAQDQYLYISTPNTTPVNFKIIQLGGSTILGTVSRDAPYIYNIGSGTDTQFHVEKSLVNSVLSNKGYIVEAEDLVYVAARLVAGSGNQAGGLVSKGLAALGTQFRVGSMLNLTANPYTDNHYTFVSVLATENNTLVQFSDIKFGVSLINNAGAGNNPAPVTLNAGESFVMAVEGPNDSNRDGLIGSLVTSDKPIAVNCGSFAGSNADTNLDLGFDQIVDVERTGKDYIFIKSTGQPVTERVLLIAHYPDTEITLNGSPVVYTLANPGDYIAFNGYDFDANGNMYVNSTKKIFAYQSVGDNSRPDFANQKMFFVPPLSCETPHVINNIPQLEKIGGRTFNGRITIVTGSGSTLNFEINGNPYSMLALNFLPGVSVVGPLSVSGNPNYETYTIGGLTGNVAVFSTSQLYLASYGSDDAATFGGYYSGFTFKPEITFARIDLSQANCVPNATLSVNSLSAFDEFQWYQNGVEIVGATSSNYNPITPGYYYVKATIAACGTTLVSDEIPVSSCATDVDSDLVNDNIDIDNDNDGITNCMESDGNQDVDLSNAGSLNVATTGNGTPSPTPFQGNTDGSFITQTAIGKDNSVSFKKNFGQPTNISLDYPSTASPSDLLTANAEFVVACDIDKTITVLNPTNQLLIDTNYDGIYESGITQFSSFEIHFRLNDTTPLAAGTATFRFNSYQTSSFSFRHINLSDAVADRATFHLIATCVRIDTDSDGIPNDLDLDSDNDGITDNIEAQGTNFVTYSTSDFNGDGLSDAYGLGINPVDTDADGVFDFLDLDSDNDGIFDLDESGNGASDSDGNGVIDGISVGINGLSDALETAADSGILNYTLTDTDSDNISNYLEADSDNDGCPDAIEAGFSDPDGNGYIGSGTPSVNPHGIVLGVGGYTPPLPNYLISAPISITTQPAATSVCDLQNVTIGIDTGPVDGYQWQVFNGVAWSDISDNAVYSGSMTAMLQITDAIPAMNGFKYRVKLAKAGNTCGLTSDEVVLTVYNLPVITTPATLIQCDEDAVADGITTVNLRQREDFISADFANLTFSYYTSFDGAVNANPIELISNPTTYSTGNVTLWVRVENANSCFIVAQLNVTVTATNIPSTFLRTFSVCDDFLDANGNDDSDNNDSDGISGFDFSSVTNDILALLPGSSGYSINYYRTSADASAETDASGNSLAITDIANYRNIGFPGTQQIWVRVESNIDNACFGLGAYVKLVVEPLPDILPIADRLICQNTPGIFETINAGLPPNEPISDYHYQWAQNGLAIPGASNYTLDVNAEGIYTVTVTSLFGCSRVQTVTVHASDIAHVLNISVTDLTDMNSILVNVSGSGDYVFSLDNEDYYQNSAFFNDVAPGLHNIYIKDLNGCGTVGPISVAVVGAPAFFTPNGDGYNDTWNIRGADTSLNKNSVIRIFDRYGKLLKQISPLGKGWDGTFNDRLLPSDDYWYVVELVDGRTAKGHFSMKR